VHAGFDYSLFHTSRNLNQWAYADARRKSDVPARPFDVTSCLLRFACIAAEGKQEFSLQLITPIQ